VAFTATPVATALADLETLLRRRGLPGVRLAPDVQADALAPVTLTAADTAAPQVVETLARGWGLVARARPDAWELGLP
jgi:hypothetical protein